MSPAVQSMLEIRTIVSEDLDELSEMYKVYSGTGLRMEMVRQSIKQFPSSVALAQGNFVGFAYCLRLAPDVLELANIYVTAAHQGQGRVGLALLNHIIETASDRWAAVIAANSFLKITMVEKRDPTSFYARNGFAVIAQTEHTKIFWRQFRFAESDSRAST